MLTRIECLIDYARARDLPWILVISLSYTNAPAMDMDLLLEALKTPFLAFTLSMFYQQLVFFYSFDMSWSIMQATFETLSLLFWAAETDRFDIVIILRFLKKQSHGDDSL